MNRILLCLVVLGGSVVNWSFAGQRGEPSGDEAAIRKADEATATTSTTKAIRSITAIGR